jgi:hypothetical protein
MPSEADQSGELQQAIHALHSALPALFLAGQLFSPLRRELVIFGAAIVFRSAPLRGDPAAFFNAMERRIKRTFFNPQQFFRDTLDVQRNAVAMHASDLRERLQDKKIKRSLKLVILSHGVPPRGLGFTSRIGFSYLDVKGRRKLLAASWWLLVL